MSFISPLRRLDTNPGDPGFSTRWDINPGLNGRSHWINLSDLATAFLQDHADTTFPVMLHGRNALDGPYCSASVPFFKKADSGFDSYAKYPKDWAGPSNTRYSGMLMYPPSSDKNHTRYNGEDPNQGILLPERRWHRDRREPGPWRFVQPRSA
jgi:hypothetical protein